MRAKRPAPGKSTTQKPVRQAIVAARKKAAATRARRPVEAARTPTKSALIVGIGASAGGLEAFTHLIGHLPSDTGLAFVLVQHLDPSHASMLTTLLSRATPMRVVEVRDGMLIEPNHIYVIPPNANMAVLHGRLSLMPRTETRGQHMPIDFFFRSLADDQKNRAIGVILSGTASDGTEGLRAIKVGGGLTFSQDEKSAKYDGMPHSAIAAGVVDFILPPEGIARELARVGRHPYLTLPPAARTAEVIPGGEADLSKVFVLLRSATGVDFAWYKPSTLKRRIVRRMVLHKIESLANYVRFLRQSPSELDALHHDLLINVTSFFREPHTFETLKKKIFPRLMKERQGESPIRVWVPGCSTGEEAYSIAICLLEYLGNRAAETPVQIFATDVSDRAVDKARQGFYPFSIAAEVASARRRRFFVRQESGYQVSKAVRDLCVFARQDVTKDPPLSKLDLISCRNLLIYLGPEFQKRAITTFHYALKPSGVLLLGGSETIGGFADLFSLADKKHKIYLRKSTSRRTDFELSFPGQHLGKSDLDKPARVAAPGGFDYQREADRILLAKYTPAGVLVNEQLDILHFRGHIGPYLEPASGTASFNLLKMAREGLLLELRAALKEAKRRGTTVRTPGVQVKSTDGFREVNLEVIPLKSSPTVKPGCFLILFEDSTPVQTRKASHSGTKLSDAPRQREISRDRVVARLQQDLTATKEYLHSLVEEQEHTSEELQSANEEILSSNEELQSTNEELETAKEELQSTNEELNTVNDELHTRNSELSELNNDLVNLLNSAQIPTIMLSRDLRIRRFTAPMEKVLNLIPSDVGRPLSDLRPNLEVPELERLILEVMDTLMPKEFDVQDRAGNWYSLRIRPYKTLDDRIEGVVIALVDIDAVKRSLEQAREAREYAEAIVDTVRGPLVVLDSELRVKTANHAFYQTFKVKPEETEHQFIYDLGRGQWNIPRLRELLEEILPRNKRLQDFEVDTEFPQIGRKRILLNARCLARDDNKTQLILLGMEEQR